MESLSFYRKLILKTRLQGTGSPYDPLGSPKPSFSLWLPELLGDMFPGEHPAQGAAHGLQTPLPLLQGELPEGAIRGLSISQ